MSFRVEPVDGRELERLVCAVLNLTGLAKCMVDEAVENGLYGVAVIDRVAAQMVSMLAPVAEHASDDELATATRVAGLGALALAAELGLAEVFADPT
jgi:AMMECR1 domain-containing protein